MDDNRATDLFLTTRWSLVLRARSDATVEASGALNELCSAYWYPIYAYIRRHSASPEDTEDLTQGYFEDLLGRGYLDRAEADKGKLRAFLLTDVKFHLAKEHGRRRALKRGGGKTFISIDQVMAEQRYGVEPVDNVTPDQLFDRAWATTLLAKVQDKLRAEYAAKGHSAVIEALEPFIAWNAGEETYATVALRLGKSESDIKVSVHRMRKRYRTLLEAEIADTVASQEDVQSELSMLAASFN
ncbi:MAG: RNA polymerase sigma factor [Roseimicrobium sp.]